MSKSSFSRWLIRWFPEAEQMFVLTTREAEGWLWSTWRHHLMSHRLKDDFDTFAPRIRPAADLAAVAADIAAAIAPVSAFVLPLEEAATHPQGPGGALIELLDLPEELRASLVAVPPGNRGPDAALAAQYLDLNRSTLTDAVVKAEKLRLAEAAGVGGWSNG